MASNSFFDYKMFFQPCIRPGMSQRPPPPLHWSWPLCPLPSLHRMPYKPAITFFNCGSADALTRIPFFCELGWEPCQHATHGVTLCGMTCIHASVSRSPREHSSVAPDKRHYRQWMSSLFCGFLPNPFIHDLLFWRASQEFVKTDLYPLSLMSLQYAICSTGCQSIIDRCSEAC